MDYIQLTIDASEEQQETLIGILNESGAVGFEQKEDLLFAYFEETAFNSYDITKSLEGFSFHSNTVKEQNWNEVWEKNFQPVIINNFCAVRAHFHQPVIGVQHEIIITPKMSFGTGHHATTYMMMKGLKDLDFRNKTVFDFGTGTGILAILAEKSGAQKITAIDNDEWSISNAQENIQTNGCSKIELFLTSEVDTEKKYDIILANINKNIILQHLQTLTTVLKDSGKIMLSGLLVQDEKDIVKACTNYGLSFLTKQEKDNWIALLFSNGL